jgi:hypothetical protein
MFRQRSIAIAALLSSALCGLVLVSARDASAIGEPDFTCKKVHHGKAKVEVDPSPNGRPPVVIGDSTVMLPIPDLALAGYNVNARSCRGFREAVNVATRLRAKGHLPHLVLINDYGNGGVSPELIAEALDATGPKRVLGLVTEYDADTGHPPAPDTSELFRAERRYPHRVLVLDWVKYSLPHHFADPAPGSWFIGDLFHPSFAGADAYAQFLSRALPLAKRGAFPPLP